MRVLQWSNDASSARGDPRLADLGIAAWTIHLKTEVGSDDQLVFRVELLRAYNALADSDET